MNSILELLSNDEVIAVNRMLIHAIGLNEAIVFSELCNRNNYLSEKNELDADGYFYYTAIDLEYSTGLSEKQILSSVKSLHDLRLIHYKLKGIPAKKCFKIIATAEMLEKIFTIGIDSANRKADATREQNKNKPNNRK